MFGFKEKEPEIIYKEEIEPESRKYDRLKKEYEKVQQKINQIEGIEVKLQSADINSSIDYVFYLNDNSYCFYPRFISRGVLPGHSNQYEEAINAKPMFYSRTEWHIENNTSELIPIQSEDSTKEVLYRIEPIQLLLTNGNNIIKIIIKNFHQDMSPIQEITSILDIKNFYNLIDIPDEVFNIHVLNGLDYFNAKDFTIFRIDNDLYFFRLSKTEVYVALTKINVDNILFFKEEGELRYESQITGGGGNGISTSGAVVGTLLFGAVGGYVGANKNREVESINSSTIEHDTRVVTLVFVDDKIRYRIALSIAAMEALEWLIPEKRYDYVIEKRCRLYEKNNC